MPADPEDIPVQVCLNPSCARQEADLGRATCRSCGTALWLPAWGPSSSTASERLDEAIRLIRAGRRPWERA